MTGNEVILKEGINFSKDTIAPSAFFEGITYNTDVPCEHCTCGKRT